MKQNERFMISKRQLEAIIFKNIWEALPQTNKAIEKFTNAITDLTEITFKHYIANVSEYQVSSKEKLEEIVLNIFKDFRKKDSCIKLNTPTSESTNELLFVSIHHSAPAEDDFIDIDALERNSLNEILYEADLEREDIDMSPYFDSLIEYTGEKGNGLRPDMIIFDDMKPNKEEK